MGKGLQWMPTIHVDSLDKALAQVTENGGRITHPKRPITGTGYLAYCEDPKAIFSACSKKTPPPHNF